MLVGNFIVGLGLKQNGLYDGLWLGELCALGCYKRLDLDI